MPNFTLEKKGYLIAKVEKCWLTKRLETELGISTSPVFRIKKDGSRKVQTQGKLVLMARKCQLRNKIMLF